MQNYLIKNITVVNEGASKVMDVLLSDNKIERIDLNISTNKKVVEINGENKHLLPGVIDDQVHFREPGLTHKATIYTESKAGIAGGVTSFMEMPNTVPPVFTQRLLEEKFDIAKNSALSNFSFFMGTSNDNAEEALRTNDKKKEVCGIKIFLGSSTGGLLVDNFLTIDRIFANSEVLIATHCEDEKIIAKNRKEITAKKSKLDASDHPRIRNEEACYESSSAAVQIAKKHGTRLHILHISTEKELDLFSNKIPLKEKRITSEVCVHHLHFSSEDYDRLGNLIKCNPAIKAPFHRQALWEGLLDDRLDIIATDHAPHTLEEKQEPYEKAYAGLPLVQHPLLLMLHYVKTGKISLEKVVEKMSHAVANCFQINNRGFIRESYQADLVIADLHSKTTVQKENLYFKCGWSPLEGRTFSAGITHTFVNGHLVYNNGTWNENVKGERLQFDR
ncbi:MAG TPA: dihydroorotase [Flavitalea sp.]|nr:dihydroorotase [Flavitalea sp.]